MFVHTNIYNGNVVMVTTNQISGQWWPVVSKTGSSNNRQVSSVHWRVPNKGMICIALGDIKNIQSRYIDTSNVTILT